ncbi:hypothetical protein PC111_g21768 [Phytophthora cactorum]|uniref:Uncharacterized protein n=2 Tax=Phytophthora cactorum TaxID=29920 RepID=A0A8T1ANI2_9STRA|nr:hypothetical protein PC111_g21768 [Phytophthora cactorum]KAG2877526.1 hypothetical protein PC114_g23578 [Phytophthora cactorum]KAG2885475.1 hypothetical protein PC115_g21004 [Phytophthora cactorum]KAG3091635.1 hypothetical protein PC122_g6910 [Phytophthora cactorum]
MKLYQTFYKRSSMTLADRNKKIKESYVQLGLEAPDLEVLLDENFLIAYCATCLRTLVHRSVVGRANVYVAMFARPGAPPRYLNVALRRDEDHYYLIISQHDSMYNHRIDSNEFSQIARNHMDLDNNQLDEVN